MSKNVQCKGSYVTMTMEYSCTKFHLPVLYLPVNKPSVVYEFVLEKKIENVLSCFLLCKL